MKNIFIAGSTGSIGMSAVSVALSYPEELSVNAIGAGHYSEELKLQVEKLKPLYCVVSTEKEAKKTKEALKNIPGIKTDVLFGEDGLKEAAYSVAVDIVLNAISGSSGMLLSYHALEAGKQLALANKESMVMAGDVLNKIARLKGVGIIPVDSEHSALFQCLNCGRKEDVKKLILTASGGPFYKLSEKDFSTVTVDMALNHPKWKMGKKITIDSSTLANKGLEIIEAQYLFGVEEKDIAVLIHPQAVIHSMVEFSDGSVIAQMGQTDMRGPIGYALSYPKRFDELLPYLDIAKIGLFEFFPPDEKKFPFLRLSREALRIGKSMPAVFCEANEIFVNLFLENKVSFKDIALNVEKIMNIHKPFPISVIEDAIEAKKVAHGLFHSLSL